MITLTFKGEFNLPLLAEEMVAAIPGLIITEGTEQKALYSLNLKDDTLVGQFPDGTDVGAVNAVVAAHDPKQKSKNEKKKDKRNADLASARAKLSVLLFTDDEIDLILE